MAYASICILLFLSFMQCEAQLTPTFYENTCPKALSTIQKAVSQAVSRERRMAASLIRLHFHDCFVQGCDASILLDETSNITSEKTAVPNQGSVRGFDVVEAAKRELEKICPGVVSCADILTVAARDASVAVCGPSWKVKLGRRDSRTANRTLANIDIPSPFDNLDTLISRFAKKGLSAKDMVVLSGAHTIGQSQCSSFRNRIYNASDIDASFASITRRQCPKNGGNGTLAPLDLVTDKIFDNNYFKNLMQKKGLLQSDQVLFSGGLTDSIVSKYSKNNSVFFVDFAKAMIKMADIQPLTGRNGIIRRVCNTVN
ncbi:lignin-forming anionic peroxidase-like [Nicotiana tabacum]|uniref:Peroxidase n=2 Tax=Nicotiana TaxID=4085 RepID=A0A1S3XKS6_TOBAC|nr:PREDICTED: lignin-forming anionic peroxidase-like [Nicotiana sylvestris]XP_016440267.1 PREDICTED: lignin-forming anionic peroxidase-like [Nicotiana tabacum]